MLRDSVLAVSGKLNGKMFGPPVSVMLDDVGQVVPGIENKDGENKNGPPVAMNGEDLRRSIYVQVRRTRPLSVLEAFDVPEMAPNCEMRNSSTVAPQSLMLMNSQFVLSQAARFAARLQTEAGQDPAHQVTFREDAEQPLAFADEQAADFLLPHQGDGLGHSLLGVDLQRRRRVQTRHGVNF